MPSVDPYLQCQLPGCNKPTYKVCCVLWAREEPHRTSTGVFEAAGVAQKSLFAVCDDHKLDGPVYLYETDRIPADYPYTLVPYQQIAAWLDYADERIKEVASQ